MKYFDREGIVDIGVLNEIGVRIRRFELNFDIRKNLKQEFNKGNVRIRNLSDTTSENIDEINDSIVINAGYIELNNISVIHIGNITKVDVNKDGNSVETQVESLDGVGALRDKKVSFSYKEKTRAKRIIEDLAEELELDIRRLPQDADQRYETGFSYTGPAKRLLSKLSDKINHTWSIQNNELLFLKDSEVLEEQPIIIERNTGLLKTPERLDDISENLIETKDPEGLELETLLKPEIIPGKQINLNFEGFSGQYKVLEVRHKGDFRREWKSFIKVIKL